MINPDRLTVKSGEALNEAIAEARRLGNPVVYDTHLLSVLLGQDESIVVPVLQKLFEETKKTLNVSAAPTALDDWNPTTAATESASRIRVAAKSREAARKREAAEVDQELRALKKRMAREGKLK